jgi:hypothetical protein
MKCDDCKCAIAKFVCPKCGMRYCRKCNDETMGVCFYCAPALEPIKKKTKKK